MSPRTVDVVDPESLFAYFDDDGGKRFAPEVVEFRARVYRFDYCSGGATVIRTFRRRVTSDPVRVGTVVGFLDAANFGARARAEDLALAVDLGARSIVECPDGTTVPCHRCKATGIERIECSCGHEHEHTCTRCNGTKGQPCARCGGGGTVKPTGVRLGGSVSFQPRVLALACRRMAELDEWVRIAVPTSGDAPLVVEFACGWWVQMGLRETALSVPIEVPGMEEVS